MSARRATASRTLAVEPSRRVPGLGFTQSSKGGIELNGLANSASSPRPLDGLLVVSIEQALAAPLCTGRLAETDARVTKIELSGRLDFVRGAYASRGGKSFIAFHSTTAAVKVFEIDGVADLKGLSSAERCKALIRIVHPTFRDQLTLQARELRLL
ncbi:acetyl-CoA hydrolase/transferase C-terminal domain-containing protein [Paraburkholderia panacisoli]|uniref:acetyl-CoA hydrolase/transferase C-terminal domain-containing protein n=1 Tax=Paraburkholderia panacisoli TaxID=2603818 RepID=UPI00319E7ADC